MKFPPIKILKTFIELGKLGSVSNGYFNKWNAAEFTKILGINAVSKLKEQIKNDPQILQLALVGHQPAMDYITKTLGLPFGGYHQSLD